MTSGPTPQPYVVPPQSPLFHATNAARYERQSLIATYEDQYSCCLIVVMDAIFWPSITLFEELIYDADPQRDLHLILHSPGGDGETAVRMVRSAQARCRELTVIIPDQAKSAATLLAMGAHHILMSPFSDLGPVDPQFQLGAGLVSAKDIIAAVDDAAQKVQAAPATYPLYASLLSDVSALMVQQARSALDRSEDLLREALRSNPDRKAEEVEDLSKKLTEPLISRPKTHAALFGLGDAKSVGLPVLEADLKGEQWQLLWRLWTKYVAIGGFTTRVYEGAELLKYSPGRPLPKPSKLDYSTPCWLIFRQLAWANREYTRLRHPCRTVEFPSLAPPNRAIPALSPAPFKAGRFLLTCRGSIIGLGVCLLSVVGQQVVSFRGRWEG